MCLTKSEGELGVRNFVTANKVFFVGAEKFWNPGRSVLADWIKGRYI